MLVSVEASEGVAGDSGKKKRGLRPLRLSGGLRRMCGSGQCALHFHFRRFFRPRGSRLLPLQREIATSVLSTDDVQEQKLPFTYRQNQIRLKSNELKRGGQ
ncbi:hypothetical protein CEXT_243611 [Caerostris extrusa]|uniref:Uncharacterized protein n=1 Tax=Caerostris extrusa TaxID=172846 RepID=A0AAV4RTZ6_CAEEX|nr:hypothetical protein CEXT_243611 [Caerostris extrusa]